MPRSKLAPRTLPTEASEAALAVYMAALNEVVSAVLVSLSTGKKAQNAQEPSLSMASNGMPSMSDGWLNRSGPPDYLTVLDPAYGDAAGIALGRYPAASFPAVQTLLDFTPNIPTFTEGPSTDISRSYVKLQLEAAVNAHLARDERNEPTDASARSALMPALRGLFEPELDIALVAPIALVHFEFDTLRLLPDVLVMRMSAEMQKARWSAKAYGAKGHDSVLAASTHAFVVTGWTIKNLGFLGLANALSNPWDNSTAALERLFAATRLITGVDTGYAQEIRLARGWRGYGRSDKPEVFAAPARGYPEAFDDFGWVRDDLPRITRADMEAVGRLLTTLDTIPDPGLELALRRLNAATTRNNPADAILDAVIALEVLLGDKNNESISWKLRMRAAALVGIAGERAEMQSMHDDILTLYKERSSIVHGLSRKASAPTPEEVRHRAISALRRILRILVDHPKYLNPLTIDAELLLTSSVASSREGEASLD